MKFKNLFIILSLFKALICGVSPITSTYDDANNYVTGMGNRPVLVGNDDQAIVVDSFTSASNAKRINGHSDTIDVTNIGAYNPSNCVYGISYSQTTPGNHTYNITNNTVRVPQGDWAVYLNGVKDSSVYYNHLRTKNYVGDYAVSMTGSNNSYGNNTAA